jgi:ACS family hexuronate transporter-like MFS transporter
LNGAGECAAGTLHFSSLDELGNEIVAQIRHLRWWLVFLLFLATIINYLDRQTLSVLAPLLRDRFGMSNSDYSRILFAFLLAYCIMQSGSGVLMDRLGTRAGFALALGWWSIAATLHSLAGSVLSFGILRFLLGMGEGGNWPGAVKAVSEWFPAKQRAFAIGFFNSGSCLGAVLAPPLVAWIALHWGWRMAFLVTGGSGFLLLVAWIVMYHPPQNHPWVSQAELDIIRHRRDASIGVTDPEGPQADEMPHSRRWVSLLRNPQVWTLIISRMLADPVWWFYVFWLPEYFRRERDFSLAMIGYLLWIPFLTADLGNFFGGGLSGYLIRRGRPVLRARKSVMLISAVAMLAGIPAVFSASASLALVLISLATFAYASWAANILTLPTDLFPQHVVASVSGMSGTGAALGGMLFMLITGVVVDHYSYVPIFLAAGLMPLMAAGFVMVGID